MHDNERYFDAGKMVDEVLKTEPRFLLPDNFAEMVAEKVDNKYAWGQYFKEFLIYLSVFVGMGIAITVMAFIWFGADWKMWFNFIVSNAGLVAGICIISVFVLFADRVLLRYFMFKSKLEVV